MTDPRRKPFVTPGMTPCEGQLYRKHECSERMDLNEVLVPRNVFQKMKAEDQSYYWHEINCAINCAWFHERYGHSRMYRAWHYRRVCDVYEIDVVERWLNKQPTKL